MTRTDSLIALEQEVGVMIRRVRRMIGERARAVHPDLPAASYLVLSSLMRSGPVRASALVELFDIDKSAISRQVAHLIDLGLITREPDPADARAWLVSLTDEAVRRMADVGEHRRKMLDDDLAEWSAAELEDFVAQLSRYNGALNRARELPDDLS